MRYRDYNPLGKEQEMGSDQKHKPLTGEEIARRISAAEDTRLKAKSDYEGEYWDGFMRGLQRNNQADDTLAKEDHGYWMSIGVRKGNTRSTVGKADINVRFRGLGYRAGYSGYYDVPQAALHCRLLIARIERGWTQCEMAEALGAGMRTLQHWEWAERAVPGTVAKLLDVLGGKE